MTPPEKPIASSASPAFGRSENNQGANPQITQMVPEVLTEHSMNARILALAADGLKVRDISSLLGVHPEMVLRLIGRNGGALHDRFTSVTEPFSSQQAAEPHRRMWKTAW